MMIHSMFHCFELATGLQLGMNLGILEVCLIEELIVHNGYQPGVFKSLVQ